MTLEEKYENLRRRLQELGSVAVAFSGGVDSTFLLKATQEALGENCIALTVHAGMVPGREIREAKDFCRQEGIRHLMCEIDELSIEGFAENPRNRCYLCKRALFSRMQEITAGEGFSCVAEGSNLDDLGDYRPGMQAIRELGVKSPLQDAQLTKDEIRALSRKWELPTWSKPSYACLASRFVYGERITREKLSMVERAEQFLIERGFQQMRVRMHGDLARIEVPEEEIVRLAEPGLREEIVNELSALGFSYVTLDLKGFRSGSMNEAFFRKEQDEVTI